jgi:hypothetical protein
MDTTPPVSAGGLNCCPRSAAAQYEGEIARLSYLGITQEQSTDIEIQTAEGDRVTISSDARTEAALLTYKHLAFNGEGYDAEQMQLVDFQADSSFELSVVGDLNAQEKADIEALLQDIGARLKAFLAGGADADGPTAAAGRYASLESFTADIEVHRELTTLNAVEARISQVAETGDSPAAETAPEVAAPQAVPQVAAEVVPPAQQLAERVQEYRPSRKMMKHLKKLLKAFLKDLNASRQIDARQARQGEGILDRMFRRLDPQGRGGLEITASQLSVKQEWAHLRYEMNTSAPAEPQVEETA